MRRIVRVVEVGQMATNARPAGQGKVVVHMALRALQGCMKTGQGETGFAVIERCAQPVGRGVAATASSWEP